MNIFFSCTAPDACAVVLDDSRVIKMILETAQILCTVFQEWGHTFPVTPDGVSTAGGITPYRPTHVNHPCTRWAAHPDRNNYVWLWAHLTALCDEYTHRYGREHACARLIEPLHLGDHLGGITAPPRCWGTFVPEDRGKAMVTRDGDILVVGDGDGGSGGVTPRRGEADVFDGYRQYLAWKWFHQKRPPRWTKTMQPAWYDPALRVIDRIREGASDKEIKAELRALTPENLRRVEEMRLTSAA